MRRYEIHEKHVSWGLTISALIAFIALVTNPLVVLLGVICMFIVLAVGPDGCPACAQPSQKKEEE